MSMITLRHNGRSHPILAVAMTHHNLQQVGINPEYKRYSARLTHHKLKIHRHQGVCKTFIRWTDLTCFAEKHKLSYMNHFKSISSKLQL
jgi:hypothetical protein